MIGEDEINEVVDSMRSGWVTTGPKVRSFEEAFAAYVGAPYAIAVNSCTAALHLSLAALGIGPGDEVIVPTMTFCATANVVFHLGAQPVLVDVDQHGLIDMTAARRAVSPRTRAIVPVHYAGQACDLEGILDLARATGLKVVEDAAHAIGTEYRGRRIGTFGDTTAFSFYATKNMTTGEGGMITTSNPDVAARVRRLALHGMSRDAWNRYAQTGSWYYQVLEPGYKYNMTDIQAAIGIHQLRKLDAFIRRRREIAAVYRRSFADLPELELPRELAGRFHVYHIFPVRLRTTLERGEFIEELKQRNIGASVHFIPLHRHPYFRADEWNCTKVFPGADRMYEGLLSLPLYPAMTDSDVQDVVDAVRDIVTQNRIPVFSQEPETAYVEGVCQ
ncbi:MAG: DegT/DnrJ/EryC1/StrS aminotransferase family protein [Bryobacterales bacterium]|nr:DegT/DnrJ/EryC1/StrS aminotransferase family protein [Bryobacterales bacterium]